MVTNSLLLSTCRRSDVWTFKQSVRPIAGCGLWCHNPHWYETGRQPRETNPAQPVSKTRERTLFWMTAKRTSGTARFGSRLQVVPGSSVLTLDRLAGWPEPASDTRMLNSFRAGKAGSVRLG
jgi:hypothetical protein